jgi:regulatory protein
MLARRAYSVAEMRRALARKFPGSDATGEVIALLRAQGYLDDRKTAEQLASSLARNRRFGRHRVRRELKARLLDYRFIEPAIARAFEETDERALLEDLLTRKIRALHLPLSRARVASLCRSLLRQGFAAGDIMKAVQSRRELRPVAGNADLDTLEEADEIKL